MINEVENITKRIEETYALVFKKNYSYDKDTIDYSIRLLKGDLRKIGIKELEDLKKYTAINVGTGSESIALSKLGVKRTYHLDVSHIAVNSLTKYINENNINNVSSNIFDLCSNNKMDFIKEKCNFVYLNGVIQHLYNPLKAINNISNLMDKDARIFIRTYRNESWLFFMVFLLRSLFKYSDVRSLLECCISREKNNDIYDDLFLCEMFDDIFVPVINIYSYSELKNFFEKIGFTYIKMCEQKIKEDGKPYLEKEDTEESIILAFKKNDNYILNSKIEFSKPVNQLENFKNDFQIQKLLMEWNKLEEKLKHDESLQREVPNIIYDLYHYASFRRKRDDNLTELINGVIEYIKSY